MAFTVIEARVRLPNGGVVGVANVQVEVTETGQDPQTDQIVTVPHVVRLGFSSSSVTRPHWLQFHWNEAIAVAEHAGRSSGTQVRYGGAVGDLHYTGNPSSDETRIWSIDTLADSSAAGPPPWYDHAAWNQTTDPLRNRAMLDAPLTDPLNASRNNQLQLFEANARFVISGLRAGTASHAPIAASDVIHSLSFVSHFDTYLVVFESGRGYRPAWHVEWTAQRTLWNPERRPARVAINAPAASYGVGRHGNVYHLPTHLNRVLAAEFPAWAFVGGNARPRRLPPRRH